MAAILCASVTPTLSAQEPRPTEPGIQSFGIWSALWWQWALNKTAAESPLLGSSAQNPTRQYCEFSGLDSVWFAGGTFGTEGPLLRECSVPTGTRLFLPVANVFFVRDPFTDRQLKTFKAYTRKAMDGVENLVATMDGVSVLQPTRVTSPAFVITLPPGNIFFDPEALYKYEGRYYPATSEGVWVMTSPLSTGKHVIHVHAEFATGEVIDVTYTVYVI
jgi:hypothetical protein